MFALPGMKAFRASRIAWLKSGPIVVGLIELIDWMNDSCDSWGVKSCERLDVVVIDMSDPETSGDAISSTVSFNESISIVPDPDRTPVVGPSSMMKNTESLSPNQEFEFNTGSARARPRRSGMTHLMNRSVFR